MDAAYERILMEQRAARDHIAQHGVTNESALWIEDWVKEEVLYLETQFREIGASAFQDVTQ